MSARVPILSLFTVLMNLWVATAAGQVPDSVTVAPNEEYQAGSVWRFLWGSDYRNTWATPVRVPILDLDAFGGGLTPLRRGGGLQTLSLRFAGADGKEYSFRSINKDPTAVLPPELRQSLAADLVQDQISAQHPYGALVVDSILGAVGVLHADPVLFAMPDDPRLGEFREDFAGALGLIEERPDENAGDEASFYGANRVVGTERLFERVDESADDRVDPNAYLQARLVDFLLGDWDRHRDQWRWAQFGGGSWQPIPRDRDQAFARLDGFFPSKARFVVPQLVGFSDQFVSVLSLSWSGREMDRRFLAPAGRHSFDSLATYIQDQVTDSVIEGAVAELPPEIERLDGASLRQRLRARRDSLHLAADQYYQQLAKEVDLHASDDDEILTLVQDTRGLLHLTLAKDDRPDQPYVTRVFSPLETTELRVRMHGGDDVVLLRGQARLPFTVRVVTGGGDDAVVLETPTRGLIVYDERGELSVEGDRGVLDVRTRAYDEWDWSAEAPAPRRDWGHAILAAGDFGYSSDYGVLLGVGASRARFGFRRDPYHTFVKGVFSVSTTGKIEALAELDYRFEARPARFFVTAGGTQFDVLHYYGAGNDLAAPEPESFYDVQRGLVGIELGLGTTIGANLDVLFAPQFRFNRTESNEGSFIGTMPNLYGTGDLWQVGARAGGRWRSASAKEGLRGSIVDLYGWIYPPLADVTSAFGALDGEWRGYLPLTTERVTLLAFRAGGRTIWGEFPWYESAFLGGDNLRGLPAQRYSGDASLYGSAELRVQVGTARFLVPELVGLLALADVGRVWLDGASPGGWHSGLGVGMWLGLINEQNILSAAYAWSEGGSRLHLDLGFPF